MIQANKRQTQMRILQKKNTKKSDSKRHKALTFVLIEITLLDPLLPAPTKATKGFLSEHQRTQ